MSRTDCVSPPGPEPGTATPDPAYDDYLAHQARIEEVITDQQRSLDRTLVTLAGGAFGLSILFSSELAADPIQWPSLLGLAWTAFGVSLALAVLSFAAAVEASKRALEIHMDTERYRLKEEDFPKTLSSNRNPWTGIVAVTNWGAVAAFMAGAALMVLFAWRNLA